MPCLRSTGTATSADDAIRVGKVKCTTQRLQTSGSCRPDQFCVSSARWPTVCARWCPNCVDSSNVYGVVQKLRRRGRETQAMVGTSLRRIPLLRHLAPNWMTCTSSTAPMLSAHKKALDEDPSRACSLQLKNLPRSQKIEVLTRCSTMTSSGCLELADCCWAPPLQGVFGRDGGIRTHDPLHPMQVRYLAALRPDRPDYRVMNRCVRPTAGRVSTTTPGASAASTACGS